MREERDAEVTRLKDELQKVWEGRDADVEKLRSELDRMMDEALKLDKPTSLNSVFLIFRHHSALQKPCVCKNSWIIAIIGIDNKTHR